MTTLDFTPATVDLDLYAGDDITMRFFFSTDAPDGAVFVGTWVSTQAYVVSQIVEYSSAFYRAVAASTNITPGTDVTKWVELTPFDLTGYTGWEAQIRSTDTDDVPFTVDATLQSSSIISLSIAGTVLSARESLGPQRWDLQVTDSASKIRTLFGGRVVINNDASRP